MRTDLEIARSALSHPDIYWPAEPRPESDEFLQWLANKGVPAELVDIFREHPRGTDFHFWMLLHEGGLLSENAEHPNVIGDKLLIFGSTLNGDLIVLDFGEHVGWVGYLSHDALYSDEPENVRDVFMPVTPSYGAFVLGVVKDAVPIDSYPIWSEANKSGNYWQDDEE